MADRARSECATNNLAKSAVALSGHRGLDKRLTSLRQPAGPTAVRSPGSGQILATLSSPRSWQHPRVTAPHHHHHYASYRGKCCERQQAKGIAAGCILDHAEKIRPCEPAEIADS